MNITVIGKNNCQACDTMKTYLDSKGLGYHYVNGLTSKEWMGALVELGARTFPQAFVDDKHIGGLDALKKVIG